MSESAGPPPWMLWDLIRAHVYAALPAAAAEAHLRRRGIPVEASAESPHGTGRP